MDNLTHSLVGLAAAKAGFERLSPRATLVCVLAANLPDSDIVALIFGGSWQFLKHHRGISHSIAGTLLLALTLPVLFYLPASFLARARSRPPTIKFKGLLTASLIVGATHPFMDWTNNYGIRFLLPWNSRWFYGDFVFILDPYLWLIFGGAAFLLTSGTRFQLGLWSLLALLLTCLLFFGPARRGGLSDPTFVRSFWLGTLILLVTLYKMRAAQRWGSRIAVTAFVIAACYWGALAYAHHLAVAQAESLATMIASQNGEIVTNLAAMPILANPLRWQTAFETDRATYRFQVGLTSMSDLSDLTRYEKPAASVAPLVEKALTDRRAQILVAFARFPVVQVDANCASQALVQLADLRYTEPGRGRGTFSLDIPVECSPQAPSESK